MSARAEEEWIMTKGKTKERAFVKVRPHEVDIYSPPGHGDTRNRRLIGPAAGSSHVEVILAEMGPQGIGEAHAHKGFDQILYLLKGQLKVICDEAEEILDPGDLGFIPEGVSHEAICMSEGAKFLVLYAPPMRD
jgi:quercetin dioxygenase-like cupin family protein